MTDTPNKPTATSDPAKPHLYRWEGHMSDGIGSTYGFEPTAHLSANADVLTLAGTRGTFPVPKAAVKRLGRGGFYPWFFKGVRIHHQVTGIPGELVFKPLGVSEREILACLRDLGYPAA